MAGSSLLSAWIKEVPAMMNFDEFLEATRTRVQEELPDTQVKIQEVNKLQGESYVGISVQPEGAAAAATFNIGPAFERYQEDPSQEKAILDKIAADAKQVSAAIPVFEVNSITDYESAKHHLVMQASLSITRFQASILQICWWVS